MINPPAYGTCNWSLEQSTGLWNITPATGTLDQALEHIQSNSMMVVSYGACLCIQDYSSSLVWHMETLIVT